MITRKTEYAIRALWELARAGHELTTVNQIASRQSIPVKYLPQIVADLTRAGLVISARGFGGGLRLARSPKDITLLEIVQVIQGPLRLFDCQSGHQECAHLPGCGLRSIYNEGDEALQSLFGSRKLSELRF